MFLVKGVAHVKVSRPERVCMLKRCVERGNWDQEFVRIYNGDQWMLQVIYLQLVTDISRTGDSSNLGVPILHIVFPLNMNGEI